MATAAKSHVYLYPVSPGGGRDHDARYYLDMGEQSEFNALRIALIDTCTKAMQRRLDTPGAHDVVSMLRSWTSRDGQIQFQNFPTLKNGTEMEQLAQARVIGVMWFVYHHDQGGVLSCGQVVDLNATLRSVRGNVDSRLVALVEYCAREGLDLQYSDRPPMPPPAKKKRPRTPPHYGSLTSPPGSPAREEIDMIRRLAPDIKGMSSGYYERAPPSAAEAVNMIEQLGPLIGGLTGEYDPSAGNWTSANEYDPTCPAYN